MSTGIIVSCIVIAFIALHIVGGYLDGQSPVICHSCGSRGAKTLTPGSILIELVLWLCFILPGLIYSIWRLCGRRKVCAACSASSLVPIQSPVGRELAQKYPDVRP